MAIEVLGGFSLRLGNCRENEKIALNNKSCKIWEIVENETEITAKTVEEAARSGDEAALQIYREAGYYLGIGIANLIYLYDPELIVIGGGYRELGSY